MSEEFNQAFIDSIADDLDIEVGQVALKIAFDAHKSLVFKTPVDSGRARMSWNISLGKPDKSVPAIGGTNYVQQGIIDNPDNNPIFITSSIPYMLRLEEGHSAQGSHMVKRTFNEITNQLR